METSKVYIKTDNAGRVLAIDGGYTVANVDPQTWLLIDEGTGDRYNLCQANYLPGPLMDDTGRYRYKWDGLKIVERTQAELTADEQAPQLQPQPAELSDDEKLRLLLQSIPVEKTAGETDLPFKLGYRWEPVYNGNAFAWQLVADPDAIGTADNPIVYIDGVPKIDNAFYLIDGVRYVYMSGEFIEF